MHGWHDLHPKTENKIDLNAIPTSYSTTIPDPRVS